MMLRKSILPSDLIKYLLLLIVGTLLLLLGYCGGRHVKERSVLKVGGVIQARDTIIDTIPYRVPVLVDSVVLRYNYVKLPVKDTVLVKGSATVYHDSVYVEIPITQKEYRDSTYQAWVSGYNPSLDSINIFQPTITLTEKIGSPNKRWGLGVQVGAGYGVGGRFQPYIGIGVSYNILAW